MEGMLLGMWLGLVNNLCGGREGGQARVWFGVLLRPHPLGPARI